MVSLKVQKSGKVPGVGMVHAPFALLPMPFPESHWKHACELAPIFNELFDRVSLDAKFLQDSLSRYSLSLFSFCQRYSILFGIFYFPVVFLALPL